MSTLFRSSMIAAVVIVSNAGLYGQETRKSSGSEVEKSIEGSDAVLYPGSGSPTSTPPASPDLSKGHEGVRRQAFSPSPRAVPGCPQGLDDAYWAALAKKASEELKAKSLSEHKNGTPQ